MWIGDHEPIPDGWRLLECTSEAWCPGGFYRFSLVALLSDLAARAFERWIRK